MRHIRLRRLATILVTLALGLAVSACSGQQGFGFYGTSGATSATGTAGPMTTGSANGGGDSYFSPSPAVPSPGANTINLQNIAFNPSTLTVSVGDTVTFVNNDSVDHHITVGKTDVGTLRPGAMAIWTATQPGAFLMRDKLNRMMTGAIVVRR